MMSNITKSIEENTLLQKVHGILENQTRKGVEKYGATVQPEALSIVEWIDHASEETADKLVYLQCLKAKLQQPISWRDASTAELLANLKEISEELSKRNIGAAVENTILLKDLPPGTVIVDKDVKYYGAPILWTVAGHDYFNENQTTLITKNILTFKAFDAAEPDNPTDYVDDYGYNDYVKSNIRQWLNSIKVDWFEATHKYDRPPVEELVSSRPYAVEAGFLSNFNIYFLRSIIRTHIRNDIYDSVFLLSQLEVYGSDKHQPLPLFTSDESRKAYPTAEAVEKDAEGSVEESDWWWLRTPHASYSYGVRSVNTSGALYSNDAHYGSIGVRPALNLPSEIRLKAVPDADGNYEIVW